MTTIDKLQQRKTYQDTEKRRVFHPFQKTLSPNLQVEKNVTGKCTETMERVTWDVMEFYGQQARIRLVDDGFSKWAHINFDDLKGEITCA